MAEREEMAEMWAEEHRACREGVGVIDMSFMSKFWVEGPGAGYVLDYLSTAKVSGYTETLLALSPKPEPGNRSPEPRTPNPKPRKENIAGSIRKGLGTWK